MAIQFDLENERTIISSALLDPDCRKMVVGSVKEEDFLGSRFRVIFGAIKECHKQNLDIDVAAISSHTSDEDYGGIDYINKLMTLEPSKNLQHHISILKKDSARATILKVEIPELKKMLADKTIEHTECIKKISTMKSAIQVQDKADSNAGEEWCEELDRRCSGIKTFQSSGYPGIDKHLIDGFAKGQISLIAARTRNAKTSTIVDITRRLLSQEEKPRIGILPNEIGKIRFLDKLISSATAVDTIKFRKESENLTLAERDSLKTMARKIAGEDDRLEVLDGIHDLIDNENDKPMDVFENVLAVGNYDIVFIDLFQRMLTDLRPASIEMALVKTQHLAKIYKVHLCLVHQINRKAEERKGKRPELGDLKGSGGYEEIPDLIILLHRPKAYKQFRKKDELEFMIAKQRDYEANITLIGEFYPEICRTEDVKDAAIDSDENDEGPETVEATVY